MSGIIAAGDNVLFTCSPKQPICKNSGNKQASSSKDKDKETDLIKFLFSMLLPLTIGHVPCTCFQTLPICKNWCNPWRRMHSGLHNARNCAPSIKGRDQWMSEPSPLGASKQSLRIRFCRLSRKTTISCATATPLNHSCTSRHQRPSFGRSYYPPLLCWSSQGTLRWNNSPHTCRIDA